MHKHGPSGDYGMKEVHNLCSCLVFTLEWIQIQEITCRWTLSFEPSLVSSLHLKKKRMTHLGIELNEVHFWLFHISMTDLIPVVESIFFNVFIYLFFCRTTHQAVHLLHWRRWSRWLQKLQMAWPTSMPRSLSTETWQPGTAWLQKTTPLRSEVLTLVVFSLLFLLKLNRISCNRVVFYPSNRLWYDSRHLRDWLLP